VLVNASARRLADDDYPGVDPERTHEVTSDFHSAWGTDAMVEQLAPSMVGDESFRRWFPRFSRVGNPPNMAAAVFRAHLVSDVRASLPLIQAPTLVVRRAESDRFTSAEQSRFLVDHIAGSRSVELPGGDSMPYAGDVTTLVDEIEEFLTGDRPRVTTDRVLATVLFTDIVGSTEHAAKVGDRTWREHLDEHDARVRAQLDAFHGREVSTGGDSFFAVFDGPARAVRCAHSIIDDIKALGMEVRAGVHTGECEVRGDNYAGIAVHVGARIAALAGPGEVLTSSTVKDLVAGSGLSFHDYGEHQLKGVPDRWRLFRATAPPKS
jgi:class 3 adenylate cyclase